MPWSLVARIFRYRLASLIIWTVVFRPRPDGSVTFRRSSPLVLWPNAVPTIKRKSANHFFTLTGLCENTFPDLQTTPKFRLPTTARILCLHFRPSTEYFSCQYLVQCLMKFIATACSGT